MAYTIQPNAFPSFIHGSLKNPRQTHAQNLPVPIWNRGSSTKSSSSPFICILSQPNNHESHSPWKPYKLALDQFNSTQPSITIYGIILSKTEAEHIGYDKRMESSVMDIPCPAQLSVQHKPQTICNKTSRGRTRGTQPNHSNITRFQHHHQATVPRSPNPDGSWQKQGKLGSNITNTHHPKYTNQQQEQDT